MNGLTALFPLYVSTSCLKEHDDLLVGLRSADAIRVGAGLPPMNMHHLVSSGFVIHRPSRLDSPMDGPASMLFIDRGDGDDNSVIAYGDSVYLSR